MPEHLLELAVHSLNAETVAVDADVAIVHIALDRAFCDRDTLAR